MSVNTPVSEPRPAGLRQKLLLLGLVVLFVSPILIAWAYTAGFLRLDSMARTNRGNLVTPPVDLRDSAATQALFDYAALQPGEWVLTYLNPGACLDPCAAVIGKLTTIRSLLGYNGQRVRVVALVTDAAPAAGDPVIAAHTLVDPAAFGALKDALEARTETPLAPQIVFIDWRRQLVMRYPGDAPPGDIKKDLSKLLRASQIR